MFRTVSLSIIRSFSLYTQQWYMSYRFADSLRAGSGRNVLILLASCQPELCSNNFSERCCEQVACATKGIGKLCFEIIAVLGFYAA